MATQFVQSLDQIMNFGIENGIVQNHFEDQQMDGRTVQLRGNEMVNFGSCSYLGLEHHEALKAGASDFLNRFGTQFSSSRSYASLGAYEELEGKLQDIFGKPVIASATTTLGHLATLPTIVNDNDAIILDMQVHSSIQMTVQLLKARGIKVTLIRHNDMERLEDKIRELRVNHDKVWYMADGVYSMYGDYAPFEELTRLMDTYSQFHLYIDDAHGMGWKGDRGEGVVRSSMEHHAQMVLAVSLNKTVAAAGGALIFPNEEMAQLVRNCGSTLIFCGPIQPPMLGACIASIDLLDSEVGQARRAELDDLINHCNAELNAWGLPQFMQTQSPLFFIPVGEHPLVIEMITRMIDRGFFLNPAAFPATPMKRAGIRFMINNNLRKSDISEMIRNMAEVYVEVLANADMGTMKVAKAFRIDPFEVRVKEMQRVTQFRQGALMVEEANSISELDGEEWDGFFFGKGNMSSQNLEMLEGLFKGQAEPHNNWKFQYFIVRDSENRPILATFFTAALLKDDMFSPASISRQVEEMRKKDPDYLISKAIVLGSLITKGEHLFIDRTHPDWKRALGKMISRMEKMQHDEKASQLMLRDFFGEEDKELSNVMLENGFTVLNLPNVCQSNDMHWNNREEFLKTLGRYRKDLRREVLRHEDKFVLSSDQLQNEEELEACYALYEQVFDRSLEMNVFKLPLSYFKAMNDSDEYDILRLYLKDENGGAGKLVAVMWSFAGTGVYNALIVGMDYEYVRSHGTYKQILFKTVERARELGYERLDLAFTAESVKKKVGARPVPARAYVQLLDHFNQAVLATLSLAG